MADLFSISYPMFRVASLGLHTVGIRRLRGGFQSYSDLAPELAVSRDAA